MNDCWPAACNHRYHLPSSCVVSFSLKMVMNNWATKVWKMSHKTQVKTVLPTHFLFGLFYEFQVCRGRFIPRLFLCTSLTAECISPTLIKPDTQAAGRQRWQKCQWVLSRHSWMITYTVNNVLLTTWDPGRRTEEKPESQASWSLLRTLYPILSS